MKTRKFTILFTFILIILVTISINVNAKTGETYYTDDGKYNYTSNVIEQTEIGTGTTLTKDFGYTTRNGEQYNQEIFMLSQKSDSSKGLKAVTWAISNESQSASCAYTRAPLDKIAEDYELNHPGWKVVGGINGDQYYQYFGTTLQINGSDVFYGTPYYGFRADGEDWFSIDAFGRVGCNTTGFLNNGTSNQLVYGSRSLAGFKLSVYDENNNFIKKFDITELNPLTKNKKTSGDYTYVYSIYSAYYFESEDAFKDPNNASATSETPVETKLLKEYPVSSNNDLYVVGSADKAYVSNSKYWAYKGSLATDAFFGKGTITSIEKSVNLKAKQFAIETTNSELLNILKEGCYVVAEYELDSEIEQCESSVGWHTLQRYNGVDQNVSNSYNTRPYPRAAFGATSDGTIYLITSNGANTTPRWGMYAEEINALCKCYGIQTAFQMDGGGSVTMIVRDDDGGFKFLTTPADGSQRYLYNGLFFVVRDVDYKASTDNLTSSSVDVSVNITDYGTITNIEKTYVNLSGKANDGSNYYESKELTDGKVSFDNLVSNSEYVISLSFKTKGEEDLVNALTKNKFTTLKTEPKIAKAVIDLSEDRTLKISTTLDDPDSAVISNLKVSFDGGNTFIKMNSSSYSINEFNGDPLGSLTFEIMYDLNDGHEKKIVIPVKLTYSAYTFLDSFNYKYNDILNSIILNN